MSSLHESFLAMQQSAAGYLQKKTGRLSPKMLLIGMFLFAFLACSAFVFIVLDSFRQPSNPVEITPIRSLQHVVSSKDTLVKGDQNKTAPRNRLPLYK